jgi:polysaccharide export outer membrane protein
MDPSVVGRWEFTPTIVPILDRIEVIERDEGSYVEVSQITPEDLVPVVEDFQTRPGDLLRVEIFDFIVVGQPYILERQVDAAGTIDIPQLGRVPISGLTIEEVADRIGLEIVDRQISNEPPLIAVTPLTSRDPTFGVFGAIAGVGRYRIPEPNYRLLEALTEAGGVPPSIPYVRVIRQVSLDEQIDAGVPGARGPGTFTPARPGEPTSPTPEGTDLRDLIDELTRPEGGGSPNLTAFSDAQASAQPAQQDAPVPPPIDLPDTTSPQSQSQNSELGDSNWMFLDGRWVKVQRGAEGAPSDVPSSEAVPLVTQRILEIPTKQLLAGVAEYNIVIRPGDLISVPPPEQGFFYISGPGSLRGGSFVLPSVGRMTLKQAIASSGGLGPLAIPERVDLIRRIGRDREGMVRLNLRAIYEGTQPDIFLKPEDQVVIGTNFWATPIAVIRNGFRVSYGFGFLLDRNFGNDVFGAPPSNIR